MTRRTIPGLAQAAVAKPDEAVQAISRTAKLSIRKGIRSGILFFDSEYLDGDRYADHVDGLETPVVTTSAGTGMKIRPTDPGISRQLYLGGVHERAATAVFLDELSALETAVTEPTIFEIGGNIGYYAALELATLDDADLHVVEPSRENIDQLEANLELNEVRDRATITRGAISDTTGEKELRIRDESNLHSFEADQEADAETETVPTWTVGDYVEEHDLSPDEISVLRMDVEGHEGKIFDGIDPVLDGSGPLLVFVEMHARLLETGDLDTLLTKLRRYDLELAYACNDNFIDGPTNELDSVEEIRENLQEYNNVETFFKRGY